MPPTGTRISKLSTVVVPITDQQRAIEFYVGTLGFEKRTDIPMERELPRAGSRSLPPAR